MVNTVDLLETMQLSSTFNITANLSSKTGEIETKDLRFF